MQSQRIIELALPLAFLLLPTYSVKAQSVYHVEVDTSAVKGSVGKMVLSLTTNRPLTNRVDVFNFTTDGKLSLPETVGGLVAGDLIESKIPSSFTRIAGREFLNELTLNFLSFGKKISFSVNVSESAANDGRPLDQFALYLLDESGDPLIPLWPERGNRQSRQGNPTFAITINGERGGQLEIFGKTIDRRRRGKIEAEDRDRDLRVNFSVTPAWISVEEENSAPTVALNGILAEFCTRRCEGAPICTGGEFGVTLADEKFLRFDDVGNLKTRVTLIESGKKVEGGDEDHPSTVRVRVIGSPVSETIFRVREVTVE